ncbi:hypothetical protein [Gillisia sp. CAL575]|uniref:hypothetical protein n=1 Tax=Gillisia sp. CAL575 TaxID=985255 RepID=UPI00039A3BF7|nr:hypothetical protein [Gillisia sp. CAL575]
MFEELEIYKSNNHFFYTKDDDLNKVCNAPKTGVGVYLVYALKNGKIQLVYIGSSGKIKQNGLKKIRNGGMCDRLINGKQFGDCRKRSWKNKIISEKIEALDIYWYETFDNKNNDIPSAVEGMIIQKYFDIYKSLPDWNKEY